MAAQPIVVEHDDNGKAYYCTVRRGVSYVASELAGQWFVSTRRLALGRWNVGGGRYYPDLAAVARECKAFAGLDVLVGAPAVPAA